MGQREAVGTAATRARASSACRTGGEGKEEMKGKEERGRGREKGEREDWRGEGTEEGGSGEGD